MKEIILARDARLALRSQAHHLDPVVLLGANGLTNAVLHEIDRALNDHELIKVRVPSDDREELESIYAEVAEKLGAARVQMIGKYEGDSVQFMAPKGLVSYEIESVEYI